MFIHLFGKYVPGTMLGPVDTAANKRGKVRPELARCGGQARNRRKCRPGRSAKGLRLEKVRLEGAAACSRRSEGAG